MLQPLLRTFSSSSSSLYSTISDSDDNRNNSGDDVADEELSQVAASTASTSSSSSSSGHLLLTIDNWIIRKVIKTSNHIPALASIAYFGLISSASMMMNPSSMAADKTATATTLMSVLTKRIGTTSNKEFSNYFSTLITPPSWIFLIWPFISVVQLITVMYSAIRSSSSSSSSSSSTSTTGNDNNDDDGDDGAAAPAVAVLKQDDLTALSLSNLMASFWLYFSSKATKDYLPLGSVLILPLVPLLSGYPVRLKQRKQQQQNKQTETKTTKARPLFVFQVYSSFTTIAAFLALTQELQYGGRVLPFIFHNKPELCAMVFLSLIGYIVSRPSKNNVVSKIINTSILWGIVSKRNIDSFALLSASAASSSISTSTSTIAATVIVKRNLITLIGLFGSISYFTTTILAIISTIKLFNFFSNSV
jgi:hypothetical protein